MKKFTKFERRVIRKCWRHIVSIKYASNFIHVEQSIIDARADLYSIRNSGVQLAIARKISNEELVRVSEVLNRNQSLTAQMEIALRAFLITFVPEKFETSRMYKQFIHNIKMLS